MYIINKVENRISKLEEKTFHELKFKERENLQEWIANNPSSLGEDLLIIQKEFNGFGETNERLDLLAIDKIGNLVIIENKLDDSGRDVTWQTIKYASYCSSLTKQEIIKIYQEYLGSSAKAEEKISEFFEDKDIEEIILNQGLNSQRLIMIAANFRKEVTSSVLWLLNFKMRIQCFKVTPFALDEQLFLNVEQILPTKATEDFAISIASKAQEEIEVQETMQNRHIVRLKFWEQFLNASNQKTNLFSNNSPSKESWIGKGIGMSGGNMNMGISGNYCRCEIYINKGAKELNKEIFDYLFERKEKIEEIAERELEWERMDNNKTSRIKLELSGVSLFEEEDWNKMIDYLIDASVRMEKAFREPIKKLNNKLKNR
ncbi:MAG: DUF4268 domain-containing protein [Bacteroidetes bacterium]|jgi:hypothetical protein|nr:DUF4268 domain-containing protein [Bacteroidota bacterium]MBT6686138.1 DUF4268 domain-containing protein [Bacteroidota bacterium]MBT7145109.1 DUF4268 domain-containing protein [Bacteroidota bacterium]MBT7491167.1 DUF4268 domain-containing protein [Bacteroidota bacterium]